jgi:hypothetical protein
MNLADDVMEWLNAGHAAQVAQTPEQDDDDADDDDDDDWAPETLSFEANHVPPRARRSDGPLRADATLCIDDTMNHRYEEAADHMGVSCKRCKHCILWHARPLQPERSSRLPIRKRMRALVETHVAEVSAHVAEVSAHVAKVPAHVAPKAPVAPASQDRKTSRKEMQQECRQLGLKVDTRTSTDRMVRMLSKARATAHIARLNVRPCPAPFVHSVEPPVVEPLIPPVVPLSPVKRHDATDDLASMVQECMQQMARMRLDHAQEMEEVQGQLHQLRNGMHSVLRLCDKACSQLGTVLDEQASRHQLHRANQIELRGELHTTMAGFRELYNPDFL